MTTKKATAADAAQPYGPAGSGSAHRCARARVRADGRASVCACARPKTWIKSRGAVHRSVERRGEAGSPAPTGADGACRVRGAAVRWAVRCDCGAQVARARPRLTWLFSSASQVARCSRPPPSCRETPPHALSSPLGFVIVQSLTRSAFQTQRSRSVGLFSLCFEVTLFSHCIVYVRTL